MLIQRESEMGIESERKRDRTTGKGNCTCCARTREEDGAVGLGAGGVDKERHTVSWKTERLAVLVARFAILMSALQEASQFFPSSWRKR